MSEFHLLRPILLLFFFPIALLVWQLWKTNTHGSRWHDLIDSELLNHLLDVPTGTKQRWPVILLALILSLLIIAAAGPTWQRLPQQVEQKQDALIILLDLSLSMRATDIKPSRVGRAQHKLRDILRQRKEGLTAMAVFAGDAHTVTPFTDDADTIEAMVSSLVPEIMPKLGSRPDLGIQLAQQLMADGGITKARVLLVADEISELDIIRIKKNLNPNMALSLLAVGTVEGGPIKFTSGGFFKDESGNIVVPKLNPKNFRALARETGARLSELKVNSSDINYLIKQGLDLDLETSSGTDREFDVWQDMGPWLVLCCLPFALLAFRRGWIIAIACIVVLQPQPALAFGWDDLWLTKDQQAQRAIDAGDAKVAAEKFTNKRWKGSAHYRAGEYDQAIEQYDALSDNYNKGNALARAGKLKQASKAYAEHLEENPNDEDAAFNKALVDKLLEQQQENQQDQDQNNQDQQEQDQQDQQEQENSEQSDQDQQSQDQQQQDQQESEQQQNESDSENEEAEQQQSEQSEEEQQEQEAAEQEQQSVEEQEAQNAAQEQQAALSEEELDEAEQALEQWLRKVPDDPGGLLRQKFRYESDRNKRNREYADEDSKVW